MHYLTQRLKSILCRTGSSQVLLWCLTLVFPLSGEGKKELDPFLEYYCYDCHGGGQEKGGLDLEALEMNLSDPANAAFWEHAFQRIEEGEMPPKKKNAPPAEEAEEFLALLRPPLLTAAQERRERDGRGVNRRLTRAEYERSVQHLLGISVPLIPYLPHDTEKHGYHTVSEAQQISSHTMDNYLEASGFALDYAFQKLRRWSKESYQKTINAPQLTAYKKHTRGPQLWKEEAVFWKHRNLFFGRIPATRVPTAGKYRFTLSGVKALNGGEDQTVWGLLQTGSHISSNPLTESIGLVEATSEPQTISVEGWMEEGELLKLWNADEKEKRISGKPYHRGGWFYYTDKDDIESEGAGGISVKSITVEKIHPMGNWKTLRKKLFMDIPPLHEAAVGENYARYYKKLLTSFARRAWRRPVTEKEVAPYLQLSERVFTEQKGMGDYERFTLALKTGYQGMLCSPHFLQLIVKERVLDDYEISSRVSYALTSSPPNAALLKAAKAGALSHPEGLRAELLRLLNERETREEFVQTFTDQWLDLDRMNATSPDPRKYPTYDQILHYSLEEETRAFIGDLIENNLSVKNFLQSDFMYQNSRLVRHYESEKSLVKPGEGLKRVRIPLEGRSGLLAQGALHKVTADGAVTSPVIRGVWISEKILGRHISPPPPDIPSIEPDIRGAKSIKAQLTAHSSSSSCQSCHVKIDPPGFALEKFDPTGRVRRFYGKPGNSAPVDTSGVTYEGTPFHGFNDWRAHHLQNPEALARSFINQFITYATGSAVGFADQQDVSDILEKCEEGEYGLRDLILQSMMSPLFLNR